jgi:hypothetical protein
MNYDDPDIRGRAHVALDDANEAANRSCFRNNSLCNNLNLCPQIQKQAVSLVGRTHKQKADERRGAPAQLGAG